MTEQAGAVTGELELETRIESEGLDVMVRYAGAEEWYTVVGSPMGSPVEVTGPAGEPPHCIGRYWNASRVPAP